MKAFILALAVVAVLTVTFPLTTNVLSQGVSSTSNAASNDRRQRFSHNGVTEDEGAAGNPHTASEAPTGFDNLTNGFSVQGPAFESLTSANVRHSVLSTTTGSSSNRSKQSRTAWDRHTTRKAAGSATRTW